MELESTFKPLVSVIIPVYNVKNYLNQCLTSVLAQTYQNLEIILVDDGSTDGSREICDAYAFRDRRIMVLHQDNAGVSAARNRALDRCHGEYLTFVDADDYIEKDLVEVLLHNLLAFKADVVSCYSNRIYLLGDVPIDEFPYHDRIVYENKEELLSDLFRDKLPVEVWGKLFKRTVFRQQRFNTNFKCAEDVLLWENLSKNIHKAVFLHLRKYKYVIHGGSLFFFKDFKEAAFDDVRVMKKISRDLQNSGGKLQQIGDMRYYDSLIILLKRLQKCGVTAKYAAQARICQKEIKDNVFRLLRNPVINWRKKVSAVFISLNLRAYYFLIDTYSICNRWFYMLVHHN